MRTFGAAMIVLVGCIGGPGSANPDWLQPETDAGGETAPASPPAVVIDDAQPPTTIDDAGAPEHDIHDSGVDTRVEAGPVDLNPPPVVVDANPPIAIDAGPICCEVGGLNGTKYCGCNGYTADLTYWSFQYGGVHTCSAGHADLGMPSCPAGSPCTVTALVTVGANLPDGRVIIGTSPGTELSGTCANY